MTTEDSVYARRDAPASASTNVALNFREGIEVPVLQGLERSGLVTVTACLTTRDGQDEAARHFPEARIHVVDELHAEGAAGIFEGVDTRLLTPELLAGCKWAEPVALSMMDRIDVHRSLTYRNRLDLFQYLLVYWEQEILSGRISLFFSRETPHEVADFALFVVMKRHGLRTPMFAWTSLPGRWIFTNDYRIPRDTLCPKVTQRVKRDHARAESLFHEIVDPLRNHYEAAQPEYMKTFSATTIVQPTAMNPEAIVRRSASAIREASAATARIVRSVEQPDAEGISRAVARFGGAWHTLESGKRLQREYMRRVGPFDPSAPYIYYAMGYQPENTNCPEGDVFGDQLRAVSLLSACAPAGWRVVVKEHPNQLKNNGRGAGDYGFLGRKASLYGAMAALENVVLVDTTTAQFDLIDHARAVATLTGTVGWEAVARGVPVIAMGHPWYADAPNVWVVRSTADCETAVRSISTNDFLRGAALDSALRSYLADFDQVAQRIIFNDENARNHGVPFDATVNTAKLDALLRWYLLECADS